MKKLLIAGVVLFAAVWALAQSFNPPQLTWSGPIATSVTQCQIPAVHGASECPVEDTTVTPSVIHYYKWNGSAWVEPTGTPGPQGPAGPAGPVQSFTSLSCNPAMAGSSGLTASNCVEK